MEEISISLVDDAEKSAKEFLRSAMVALRAGDFGLALLDASKARNANFSPYVLIVFAAIAHSTGRDVDALAILDQAIDSSPGIGNYPDAAAAILLKLGRKVDGIFNLKLGTHLPSDPFLDEIIGNYFGDIKIIFDSFVENRPLVSARLMMERGLYSAAIQQLETYIGVSGGDRESFALIVESAIFAGLLRHAEVGMAALVSLDPEHPKLGYFSLAISVMRGDIAKVLEVTANFKAPTSIEDALDLYRLAFDSPFVPRSILKLANEAIIEFSEKRYDVGDFHVTSSDNISFGFVCGRISSDLENLLVAMKDLVEVKIYILSVEGNQSLRRLKSLFEDIREVASIDDDTLIEMIRSDCVSVLFDCIGAEKFARPSLWTTRMAQVQILWPLYNDYYKSNVYDYRLIEGGDSITLGKRDIRINCPMSYPVPPAELMGFVAEARSLKMDRELGDKDILRLIAPHPGPILLDDTLDCYFSIMRSVPKATLSFVSVSDINDPLVQRILAFAEKYQCIDRIELIDPMSFHSKRREILLDADLVLDVFPFGNINLVTECLWIGALILTLSGETAREKVSSNLVRVSGVSHLIAMSKEHFVNVAIELLGDQKLRAKLRQEILRSQDHFTPESYAETANELVEKIQSRIGR